MGELREPNDWRFVRSFDSVIGLWVTTEEAESRIEKLNNALTASRKAHDECRDLLQWALDNFGEDMDLESKEEVQDAIAQHKQMREGA